MIRASLLAVVIGSVAVVGGGVAQSHAQAMSGLPKASGTVKATADGGFTLTAATGDVAVKVPAGATVLLVPPGAKTLKDSTPGTVADIVTGDRAMVTGTAGDSATALTATRVVLMKAGAIAASHAAEEQAWQQGGGGIVKSVDPAGGSVVLSNGGKTVTVNTTAQTVVKRYAPGSVKFDDAVLSTLASVKPGDQMRVRGQKSADGSVITADGIVVGSFMNYSGLLTGIDAAAGTVTLKDLATKKVVTVAVTSASDVHRLPAQMATMLAARMKGGAAAPGAPGAGGPPAGGRPGGYGGGQGGPGGAGRDLSSMLQRLPTETLAGLKPGEAVMMVATASATASGPATAVTVVVGVEPLITASGGEAMTLSPWSLGGGDTAGVQ